MIPKLEIILSFKKLSILRDTRWKRRVPDMKASIERFKRCQKYKDCNAKNLSTPETLNISNQKWGLLTTDFIVGLLKTMDGFDSVMT